MNEQRVSEWCVAHPAALAYLQQLNQASVRWAVFAGTAVSLATGNRVPTDLDIIVHDDDFDRVKSMTKQAKVAEPLELTMQSADGLALHYHGFELSLQLADAEVEVMARAGFSGGQTNYNIAFSDLAVQHRLLVRTDSLDFYIANPFDTVSFKAIMQRGAEQQKFDFEDTKALLAAVPIDFEYAKARAHEIKLDDRALHFLHRAGLPDKL